MESREIKMNQLDAKIDILKEIHHALNTQHSFTSKQAKALVAKLDVIMESELFELGHAGRPSIPTIIITAPHQHIRCENCDG